MHGDTMKDKLHGSALLLLTTIIWGSSFVAQTVGMDHLGPFTFQAVRCAMAFIGLLPLIFLFDLKNKNEKPLSFHLTGATLLRMCLRL